jgi:hypothetical protein
VKGETGRSTDLRGFTCQCRADKILNVDDETHAALVAGHLVDALQLAIAALTLVDVPQETTLDQLQALEAALQALETSTVMLLLQGGVTWESMAKQLGVTRQSLHRRLSRRTTSLRGRPRKIGQLENEWKHLLPLLDEEFKEISSLRLGLTGSLTARKALRKK